MFWHQNSGRIMLHKNRVHCHFVDKCTMWYTNNKVQSRHIWMLSLDYFDTKTVRNYPYILHKSTLLFEYCVNLLQYWGAWNNYNTAINYLCKEPKYRIQAVGIAKAEGLIGQKRDRKDKRTKVCSPARQNKLSVATVLLYVFLDVHV